MDVLGFNRQEMADLPQNFDNLTTILNEYMQKLRGDPSHHASLLNFTHAALFLQHTCGIYGRKVDFLHDSVVQLLELITSSHSSEKCTQATECNTPPPKHVNTRRRRATTAIMLVDFHLLTNNTDNPVTRPRRRRKKVKDHTREAAFGRLIRLKKDTDHEHCLYDDDPGNNGQFINIGRKNEFRLHWPVDQAFSLGEDVTDRGSAMKWSIFDARVINMPTPEYSDDGVITNSASEYLAHELNAAYPLNLDDIQEQEAAVASKAADAACLLNSEDLEEHSVLITHKHAGRDERENIVLCEKLPQAFKLPPELRKESKSEIKICKGYTAFLFSDVLKHSLNMNGLLPNFKTKKTERQLIAKHIKNIMKRYNLDSGCAREWQSLVQKQRDFLGFEPVLLQEVDDDLEHCDENDVDLRDVIRNSSPLDDQTVTSTGNDHQDYQDELVEFMRQHQNNMEVHIGNNNTVVEWQASMEGRLKYINSQKSFDVHSYGSDIINNFKEVGDSELFTALAGGLSASEVCRYFMSSLMLANTNNVMLEENGSDTMKLTLLSRERHHEMEQFLVNGICPSDNLMEGSHQRRTHISKRNPRREMRISNNEETSRYPSIASTVLSVSSPPRVSTASEIIISCGLRIANGSSEAGPSRFRAAPEMSLVSLDSTGPACNTLKRGYNPGGDVRFQKELHDTEPQAFKSKRARNEKL